MWLNLHSYTAWFHEVCHKKGLNLKKIVVEVKKLIGKIRIHKVFAQLFFMKLPVLHNSALDESDSFYDFTKYFIDMKLKKKLEIRKF